MRQLKRQFLFILVCAISAGTVQVAEPALKDVVSRGFDFLQKAQNDKGQISPRIGSGVTSLAVTAALRNGRKLDDPLVANGLKALEGYVHPDGGLFYYYQLFGSALAASGMEKVDSKSGEKDWKHDLIAELAKTQKQDGSWANSNRQFMENDPNLCTAFSLLALSYCNDKPAGK